MLQGMPYFHSNTILEQIYVEGCMKRKEGGCAFLGYSEKPARLDQQNRHHFNMLMCTEQHRFNCLTFKRALK